MSDTIESLKQKLVAESLIPICDQRIIFCGKELENDRTLADYNLQKSGTIHLVPKLNAANQIKSQ